MRRLLLALCLFVVVPAYATIRDICASGCDDTTIQGCEDNSSTGDTCEIDDTRTYAENVLANLANWTLTVTAGNRHDGTVDSGPIIDPDSPGHAIQVSASGQTYEYIQCTGVVGTSSECWRLDDGTTTTFNNTICSSVGAASQNDCMYSSGAVTVHVNNMICHEVERSCFHMQHQASGKAQTWNFTNTLISADGAGAGIKTETSGSSTLTINMFSTVHSLLRMLSRP